MPNAFGPWATPINAGMNPQLQRVLEKAADNARVCQPNQPSAFKSQSVVALRIGSIDDRFSRLSKQPRRWLMGKNRHLKAIKLSAIPLRRIKIPTRNLL